MLLIVDGQQTYCDTAQQRFEPKRPNVLLLHGALNDHSVWQCQSRWFSRRGYNVLAPDLPGHGRSNGAPKTSIVALADWVLMLLDAVQVGQTMLVGHSMGALVALQATATAATRVHCLALLGAAYPMTVSAGLLAAARDDEAAAIEKVVQWSHTPISAQTVSPGATLLAQSRALMHHLARRDPGRLLYTDLMACNHYAEGESAIGQIVCPTLLIAGSGDRMTSPKASAALGAAIAHASTVVLESGHALMAEQPDQVNRALLDFANAHIPQ